PEKEIVKIEQPTSFEENLQQARQHIANNNWESALQIYYASLQSQPDNAECKTGLLRCREEIKKNFKNSHTILYEKQAFDSLLKLIDTKITLSNADAALSNVFQELKAEIYIEQGKAHLNKMDYITAEKEFNQATACASWLAEAWLWRGKTESLLAKWSLARQSLEKSLVLDPENISTKLYLSLALYETDAIQQAIETFIQVERQARADANLTQDCLAIGKKLADALKNEAQRLAQSGDKTRALQLYKVAMDYTPKTVQSLQEAVIFYSNLGETEEARRAKNEAHRLELAGAMLAAQRQAEMDVIRPGAESSAPVSGGTIRANSLSSALTKARSSQRKILLLFCTDWCGYCKKLKREILPERVVKQALGRYILVELDAEKGEGKQLAGRYGVKGYPTSIILDSSGAQIDKMAGCPTSPQEMANWLNSH
ncbi:MAG: thioredoxin family protein, partial [Candidatus Sumerlaeia bacterium]|nr:thioredoxin family protein [Candidatus Sumerlaeia bacterium]